VGACPPAGKQEPGLVGHPSHTMAASAILHRSFVDSSHHAFYSQGSSSRQGSSRRVAAVSPRQRRQQTVAASSVSGRRARVLRHVAEVESALARLEQVSRLWAVVVCCGDLAQRPLTPPQPEAANLCGQNSHMRCSVPHPGI
jgi:hypothetical protein